MSCASELSIGPSSTGQLFLLEDAGLSVLGTKSDAIKRVVGRFQQAARERLLEEDEEL